MSELQQLLCKAFPALSFERGWPHGAHRPNGLSGGQMGVPGKEVRQKETCAVVAS